MCRHRVSSSTRLHLRDCTTKQAWASCRRSTMGNYLGNHDHVLHLLRLLFHQRHWVSFPYSGSETKLTSNSAFRAPWALQMIPAILLFFGMIFLPESPRWLARKNRWEDCLAVLVLTHGHGDPNHPRVNKEYEEIKAYCEFERENADVTYWELFTPRMINRTHIGVFTQIWSQLTGMNVMMYYITYVFTMAGLSGNNLLVSSSIQYVINVAMTVPALLWVDRWGRRPTLLIGAALMATWLFANAGIL